MARKFTPEFALFVEESKLGITASLLDKVLLEGAARFLGRILPKSESVKRVLDIYDFRSKHGFPSGYIPAGYQLPLKD